MSGSRSVLRRFRPFADASIWIVAAEGADTVVFTWLSDSGSAAIGAEAEQIVLGARRLPAAAQQSIVLPLEPQRQQQLRWVRRQPAALGR